MRIAYDAQADILSLVLTSDEAVTSRELVPGLIVNLDGRGGIVGVDILRARVLLGRPGLREIAVDLKDL